MNNRMPAAALTAGFFCLNGLSFSSEEHGKKQKQSLLVLVLTIHHIYEKEVWN